MPIRLHVIRSSLRCSTASDQQDSHRYPLKHEKSLNRRDILLGLTFSLALHGLVFWVGTQVRQEATQPGPVRAALDLVIIKTTTHGRTPVYQTSIQKASSNAPNRILTPLFSQPKMASMKRARSRHTLTERVDRVGQALGITTGTQYLQDFLPPRPIKSSRVILREMDFDDQVSRPHETPLAALKKSPMTDAEVPSTTISSPVNRAPEELKTTSSDNDENQLEPIGAYLYEPPRVSDPKGNRSEKGQEANLLRRGGDQIVVAVPEYAINPKPPYPRLAIRRNYEGTVILSVEVLPDGSVREVKLLESSGHTILDRSAVKAVRKWRFKPGTKGGKPVTTRVKIPVVFRLNKNMKG